MADAKISQLADGAPFAVSDTLVIARAGANRRVAVPSATAAALLNAADAAAARTAAGAQKNVAAVAGTNAATTMLPDSLYVVDGAILTADRDYTLPASADCVVGETRVGVMMSAGNASFELVIKGNASQTINGGSAASEWSRLFITGECVVLRYVATNTWVVEVDGRIPQKCVMRLSTSASTEAANTFVRPTSQSGVFTADHDNASIAVVASSRINTRRAGRFTVQIGGQPASALGNDKFFTVAAVKNATTFTSVVTVSQQLSSPANVNGLQPQCNNVANSVPLAPDDFITYLYRSEEGSKGLLAQASPRLTTSCSLVELLP